MRTIADTHIAVSNFVPDTKFKMWIEGINRSGVGRARVLDALGFTRRTQHRDRHRVPGLPCVLCGAVSPPTADPDAHPVYQTPGVYPASPGVFRCEAGNHSFTLPDLITFHCQTKPKLRALLSKIKICEPQLVRHYVAESGDSREVSKDANAASRKVQPRIHDCTVRIVGIECATIELARQLGGQCHDELPWATAATDTDGTLLDLHWHRGRLTDLERLRVTSRDSVARFGKLKRVEDDVAAFRRQRTHEAGL